MGTEKKCSLVFMQPTRSSEADDADDNAIISLSGCGHIGDQPVALGVLLNFAGMRTLQQAGHAPLAKGAPGSLPGAFAFVTGFAQSSARGSCVASAASSAGSVTHNKSPASRRPRPAIAVHALRAACSGSVQVCWASTRPSLSLSVMTNSEHSACGRQPRPRVGRQASATYR
jgi:hypothetical protein